MDERGMALPRLFKPFPVPDIWPGVCHMPIWLLGMISRPDTSRPVEVASIKVPFQTRDDCLLSRTECEYIDILSSWVKDTLNLGLFFFFFLSLKTNRVKVKYLTTALRSTCPPTRAKGHCQTQTGSSTRYSGRAEINRNKLQTNTILE